MTWIYPTGSISMGDPGHGNQAPGSRETQRSHIDAIQRVAGPPRSALSISRYGRPSGSMDAGYQADLIDALEETVDRMLRYREQRDIAIGLVIVLVITVSAALYG